MVRSRRKRRRTATQSAASLLALALPAPLQRAADTRLGPLLMFFGLPAMLIFGLLQVNWQGGTPQLTINSQKAAELREVARNKLQNFDTQGHLQTIENNARQVWNNAQSQISQTGQGSNPLATNPQQNNQFGNGQFGSGQVAGGQTTAVQPGGVQASQAPFPSTRPRLTNAPLDYTRTPQTNATTTTPSQFANTNTGLTQQQLQQQLQEQQLYQQQLYERQLYEQQLYQQQLYQQQLYQQQLYEQQLRQQQQQAQNQWQPQTQNPWQPQTTNPWQSQSQTPWQPQANPRSSSQQTYAPQFDQFGRPFTSSNTNLTPNYTQQSAFPSNNSGRY